MEEVKRPIPAASFHGENWYRCPKCNKVFESLETRFSKEFEHENGYIYRHECGQLLDMEYLD